MTIGLLAGLLAAGCSSARYYQRADEAAYRIIAEKQQTGLGHAEPFALEPPEELLRRRLLLEQELPHAAPASLGRDQLRPVDHWPEPAARPATLAVPASGTAPLPESTAAGVTITLAEALQIAARNNRDYQSRKEDLFRAALDLDFQRSRFDNIFAAAAEGEYLQDRGGLNTVEGGRGSATGAVSRTLLSGITLTTRLGWDLVRMLQPGRTFAGGLTGDASIAVPLLRGAGRHIVAEPLTRAEREALYAVWDFERFKKEFAVTVADDYLTVLQSADQVRNQAENYRGLIASSRRAERLAEAGKLPRIQVDQSVQNELRARDRWVAAGQAHAQALDRFKLRLGLPADSDLQLDRNEFQRLEDYIAGRLSGLFVEPAREAATSAEDPIILLPVGHEGRGPLELDSGAAIRIALAERLDLRILEGRILDAQRRVVVAADGLRPELTLLGAASVGRGAAIGSTPVDDGNRLDFNRGVYQGLLTLDLPLDRAAEARDYRDSYIELERAVRDLQELEDRIKLAVRDQLRNLEQARASLQVQYLAVRLAERRVKGAALMLEAGRAQIRDLLEAQEALLTAQNGLTSAMIDYRVGELAMQRDLGVLQVDNNGLWQE